MHETPIPGFTLHSAREHNPPPALRVRKRSPQAEAETWETAPAPPDLEPIAWHPLTATMNTIGSWIEAAANFGRSSMEKTVADVQDIVATVNAAATGQAPDTPGPIFNFAAGVAESIAEKLPKIAQRAIGYQPGPKIAGYITTADGRRIPVPAYEEPVTKAEDARSDALKTALRARELDVAIQKSKEGIERAKLSATADQFAQRQKLLEKDEARKQGLFELQTQALKLAIERETSSPAQRALWGRPSTIAQEEPSHRKTKAIGMGVPGGIQETLY